MAKPDVPIPFEPATFENTSLAQWGYLFYSHNRTLSNSSAHCYLAFTPYIPLIFDNGTFVNATSCFAPIKPLKTRGILALLFGSLFAVTIVFTTINLRKHGKSHLHREKTSKVVGRRWQWYWMLFVAACGMISCFTGVDVDRDYVLGLPMSLQCFFMTLMNPGLSAMVWEHVRHWGSFQKRLQLEADPFAFKDGDLRSKIELYLPLSFYALDWLVFFLTIPRSWSTPQKQRSPQQAVQIAASAATDTRFKAGSIALAACFLIICFSLVHSKVHYRSALWKTMIPWVMFALATRTGYWVASAWRWDLNPFNLETDLGFQYSLNYLCALTILIHLNVSGYQQKNVDLVLIADRAARGQAADIQMGNSTRSTKPSWWYRNRTQKDRDLEMKIFDGSRAAPASMDDNDESGSWWWQSRSEQRKDSNDQIREISDSDEVYKVKGSTMLQTDEPPLRRRASQTQSEVSGSRSNYATFDVKPQVIRSMLDT